MEDASNPESSVSRGYQQCVDRHYRATLWHIPTTVLDVFLNSWLHYVPKAFYCNGYSLVLRTYLRSVPKLLHSTNVSTSLFPPMTILNFLLSGDLGCFQSILRGFAFTNVMEDPTSSPSE
jgi:hypothetical protein